MPGTTLELPLMSGITKKVTHDIAANPCVRNN